MTRARIVRTTLDRLLQRFGKPSAAEMESAGHRVWRDVLAGENPRLREPEDTSAAGVPSVWRWRGPVFATIVTAIAIAVFVPAIVLRSAPVVLVDASGSRGIHYGESVRRNGDGATLQFPNGTRVEMSGQTELSFEQTRDGVKIDLRRGDVIVDVPGRPEGQVRVETKDMSAVGDAFLVNAADAGSRVAVIGGQVRMQHGRTSRNLLAREEVSTNPALTWPSAAETHLALLQQAAPAVAPKETFEVASIRLRGAAANGGRGGMGSNGQIMTCYGSLSGSDERRFYATKYSIYQLIMLAYGRNCIFENTASPEDLTLRDGPEWIYTDQYDIEARIPDGPPAITIRPYTTGGNSYTPAPRLRSMLQDLLATRFKLVLRGETREVPVFFLTVATGGAKMTAWKEGDRESAPVGYGYYPSNGQYVARLVAYKASMAQLADRLRALVGRRVLDRTGITGEFKFEFLFAPPESARADIAQYSTLPLMTSPTLPAALEAEMGLKMEPGRGPVEFLTIEHIERPSEN